MRVNESNNLCYNIRVKVQQMIALQEMTSPFAMTGGKAANQTVVPAAKKNHSSKRIS